MIGNFDYAELSYIQDNIAYVDWKDVAEKLERIDCILLQRIKQEIEEKLIGFNINYDKIPRRTLFEVLQKPKPEYLVKEIKNAMRLIFDRGILNYYDVYSGEGKDVVIYVEFSFKNQNIRRVISFALGGLRSFGF